MDIKPAFHMGQIQRDMFRDLFNARLGFQHMHHVLNMCNIYSKHFRRRVQL